MPQKTKIRIAAALKKLMENKPIEKIHVSEICKTANVARPTFYYYFEDKYDLFAWIFCRSVFGTNVLSIKSAARSLNKMRKDLTFYKRSFEDNSPNALWQYIQSYYVVRYSQEAKTRLGTKELDAQTQFSICLYCYGAVGMSKEWLLTDNNTSAETIVDMMFTSMPECLRRIYFAS